MQPIHILNKARDAYTCLSMLIHTSLKPLILVVVQLSHNSIHVFRLRLLFSLELRYHLIASLYLLFLLSLSLKPQHSLVYSDTFLTPYSLVYSDTSLTQLSLG